MIGERRRIKCPKGRTNVPALSFPAIYGWVLGPGRVEGAGGEEKCGQRFSNNATGFFMRNGTAQRKHASVNGGRSMPSGLELIVVAPCQATWARQRHL